MYCKIRRLIFRILVIINKILKNNTMKADNHNNNNNYRKKINNIEILILIKITLMQSMEFYVLVRIF